MKHLYKIHLLLFSIVGLFFSKPVNAAGNENYPILVIGSPERFGTYTGEILKTEGFNEFHIDSITSAQFSLDYLRRFDIVILTETELTNRQKKIFISYIKEGGNLIAFRPDKKLATIFGIKSKKVILNEAYVAIDSLSAIGKGLITEPLQFHGTADIFQVHRAKKIASLYKNAVDSTLYPAVVMNDYGRGHAIAFMYNLPESIAYTRQGNHLFAGQGKDSIDGIRAMDMFTKGWVDTSKNTRNL